MPRGHSAALRPEHRYRERSVRAHHDHIVCDINMVRLATLASAEALWCLGVIVRASPQVSDGVHRSTSMNRRILSAVAIAAVVMLHSSVASAVCFYPGTSRSGYRIPIAAETRTSRAIVVGRVVAEKGLTEDASDPDGFTAFMYTFEVLRQLKGKLSGRITLKAQNDSGGYRMAVGEQHLLFLEKKGSYFEADACGNSSELPEGSVTLQRVEALLRRKTTPR